METKGIYKTSPYLSPREKKTVNLTVRLRPSDEKRLSVLVRKYETSKAEVVAAALKALEDAERAK